MNGDGKIDGLDRIRPEKNQEPRFVAGLTLTAKVERLRFDDVMAGSNRAEVYIETWSGLVGNFLKSDYDKRWTPENPSNIYPKATTNRALLVSDRFIEDGSYLKLKTLSLSYSFPKINLKHIQGLRLYVTGQNLLTWTKYRGYDPEVSYRGASTLKRAKISVAIHNLVHLCLV